MKIFMIANNFSDFRKGKFQTMLKILAKIHLLILYRILYTCINHTTKNAPNTPKISKIIYPDDLHFTHSLKCFYLLNPSSITQFSHNTPSLPGLQVSLPKHYSLLYEQGKNSLELIFSLQYY